MIEQTCIEFITIKNVVVNRAGNYFVRVRYAVHTCSFNYKSDL